MYKANKRIICLLLSNVLKDGNSFERNCGAVSVGDNLNFTSVESLKNMSLPFEH